MKNVENLVSSDLVKWEMLAHKFKRYLMNVLDYDKEEADFVIDVDFRDPFVVPYIDYDYEGDVAIDGVEYEVYNGTSAFENVGMFLEDGTPAFEFYTLFDKSTLKDDSLESYKKAKKAYVLQEE